MAAEVQNFDHDSQFKIPPPRVTTKMKTQRNQGGDELLKAVLTKRTKKLSTIGSTTSTSTDESKKTCISTQNQQTQKSGKLLKVLPAKKMINVEKANINKSKSKPREESNKKMCTCSPTTHEGSFRCHLHRIDFAVKNSISEKKRTTLSFHSLLSPHTVEFKPRMSRFGRAASAEIVITHDAGLSQPSVVGSS